MRLQRTYNIVLGDHDPPARSRRFTCVAPFSRARAMLRHSCASGATVTSRPEVAIHLESAIYDVERALLHVEGCFFDRLTQCWMRVASPTQVFGATTELNYGNGFGD